MDYTGQVYTIISDYKRLYTEYDDISSKITAIKDELASMELRQKELSIELELTRMRERELMDDMKCNDPKTYADIKTSISSMIGGASPTDK